jgi:choline kinase
MPIQAILLAAGVGRRLASLEQASPKCLLRFEGISLLHRHMRILEDAGISELLVVVGHLDHMIREEVAAYTGALRVSFAFNEHYRKGSIISLRTGLAHRLEGHDALVMDADVLYHPRVLTQLIDAEFRNGFLLDPRSESGGEEMMLGVRDGLVRRITRRIQPGWDLIGEGVGFFKIASEDLPLLLQRIDDVLGEGFENADYEDAIDRFLDEREAGYLPVGSLPWTEIDFDEDVEHARTEVLPAIAALLEAAASATT